ncbi:MAG: SPOR domain-containing protein, partial [Gammaproteobacteria bacterium]|nr:SPOR domain-containing protein [Gammaproteobacteria bacterium]
SKEEPRPGPPKVSVSLESRDASWLMAQPGEAFTLQLVTFSSAERLEAYLAEQARPDRFASYRLSRSGRILHVVVYGSFATRTQAETESRRLPASVGQVKPWLRTMAQVQDAIRTALQR